MHICPCDPQQQQGSNRGQLCRPPHPAVVSHSLVEQRLISGVHVASPACCRLLNPSTGWPAGCKLLAEGIPGLLP